MTFFSSSSRSFRAQSLAPVLVALSMTLWLGACEDKHIGRPCDIGVDLPPDPASKLITVNPRALECPSRVCILPAKDQSTDTGPFCTDECSSDDDCSDGERRGKGATDTRCKNGFLCRRILPKLDSNPLACKPVCVCKDFLLSDDPNIKPPSCP